MWNIEYDYIEEWLDTLDDRSVAMIFAALEHLRVEGPNLGRPLVDTLSHTRVKNLKELRPASIKGSEIRILFAFDPNRSAIMLLGGDKAKGKRSKSKWTAWYKRAIPEAERLYEEHLKRIGVKMADLNEYLSKRGISDEQMQEARLETQTAIEAYNLKQARRASNMTQVQVAKAIGVSQNRISRIENGDMEAMSIESLRRYITALGGSLTLVANLPDGKVELA